MGTLDLPEQVAALRDDGAVFVCSSSGGKDSQAMLIKLLEVIPAAQLVVVHASLGKVEWEGALELAQKQAEQAGVPFIVARAVKSFLDMVRHRHATRPDSPCWPSASNRQCTSDLKRGPIEREVRRYAKAHGFTRIVNCMGLRAGESAARAKRATLTVNMRGSVAGRQWFDWLPIHEYSEDEVFETIRAAGQEPHWAYAAGNRRLSCVFCLFGHPQDLANGAKYRPELFEEYVRLEQESGYTLHQSRRSLLDLVRDAEIIAAS